MPNSLPIPSGYYVNEAVQCCLKLLPDPDFVIKAMFERIVVDEKYRTEIVSFMGNDKYKIRTKLKSKNNEYEYSILYKLENGGAICFRILPAPVNLCQQKKCIYGLK